jgi:hypothetical protein
MVWKNVFLNKSSMKVFKYFSLPWNVVAMGLHKSMCTSPRIFFAWEPHSKEMRHDVHAPPNSLRNPKVGPKMKSW